MKRLWWVLALLGLAAPVGAHAQDFVLVANEGVSVSSISASKASEIFLKKATSWEDGSKAVPVDQPAATAVRQSFSEAVHGRSASAVTAFWQQQIFSGKDVPPADKEGDQAVLDFVRATPGAVGYVSSGAALGSGVKTLTVN